MHVGMNDNKWTIQSCHNPRVVWAESNSAMGMEGQTKEPPIDGASPSHSGEQCVRVEVRCSKPSAGGVGAIAFNAAVQVGEFRSLEIL